MSTKLLSDAEKDAILRIPLVSDVQVKDDKILITLKAFQSTDYYGRRPPLDIPEGASIEIIASVVADKDRIHIHGCDAHFNIHPEYHTPCWGTGGMKHTVYSLLHDREYVILANLACEFVQVYNAEDPFERRGSEPPGSCEVCVFHDPQLLCRHPRKTDRWTVPHSQCTYCTRRP